MLLGEARWQASQIDARDLTELQRKAALAATASPAARYAFWARGGSTTAAQTHPDVHIYTPAGMLA